MTEEGTPTPSPGRAAAILLLSLAGLVVVGRLAHEAWLARPVASAPPRPVASAPGGLPPTLLLSIVDGLRAEILEPGAEPAMPFVARLAREGASGVAIAGEPTMTACCVRTLLTGRNPDLLTAFKNFEADPVEGSVIEFLADRGARVAHAGDASGWQMTKRWIRPEDARAYPDLGPVDQGATDDASYPFALGMAMDPGVAVLVFHTVRPDHAGHKFGATGPEYRASCGVVDGMLERVVTAFRALRPDATVLVAADHGLTPRGNHGGGEPDARRAPFVLVGPRVARAAGVEIPQSSLAPTLSALLSLPPTPLAETPPALELTTLSPGEKADALDAYLGARIEVAKRIGANDVADVVERKRARAFLAAKSGSLADLSALWRELDAAAFERTGALAAAAGILLAGAWLAVLARAAGARRLSGGDPAGFSTGGVAIGGGAEALAAGAALAGAWFLALPAAVVPLLALLAFLAWRTSSGATGARALAAAGFLSLPVLAAAALALQDAFDAPSGAAAAATRSAFAFAAGLGVAAFLARRRDARDAIRGFADRHPGLLAALAGTALGVGLSMRPFFDPFVHTPILFALAAGASVALVLVSGRVRGEAPRWARWTFLACAVAILLGGRLAVLFWTDEWAFKPVANGKPWLAGFAAVAAAVAVHSWARRGRGDVAGLALSTAAVALAFAYRVALAGDPVAWRAVLFLGLAALALSALRGSEDGRLDARILAAIALGSLLHERSDAQAFAFAVLAAGCRAAGAFPAARTRLAVLGVALLVLSVRIASFHAMGFAETMSVVDTGAGIVPGAKPIVREGGAGLTWPVIENTLLQLLKFGLAWLVLVAAAARAFRRGIAPRSLPVLAADLAVLYAARGAGIVAGMWVWSKHSWWVKEAQPVYAIGAADVLLLLAALALVGGGRGRTPCAPTRGVADRNAPTPVAR